MNAGTARGSADVDAAMRSLDGARSRLQALVDALRSGGSAYADDEASLLGEVARVGESPSAPTVSIVVWARSGALPARTLATIARHRFGEASAEIVLAGPLPAGLRVPGVRIVPVEERTGAGAAYAAGAAAARGKYLCFLDEAGWVQAGWLGGMLGALRSDPLNGAVAAKTLFPDGSLACAGGIVWRDGQLARYGCGEDAADSRYACRRGVDYAAGACVTVSREAFKQAGGFGSGYRTRDYAIADLCFRLQSRGYRVEYEPRAAVQCPDRPEAGSDDEDRRAFCAAWSEPLERRPERQAASVDAVAFARNGGQTVLLADAGREPRMDEIVRALRKARYNVALLPDADVLLQCGAAPVQALGVHVLHGTAAGQTEEQALQLLLPRLSAAWFMDRGALLRWSPLLRLNKALRIVFDAAYDGAAHIDQAVIDAADCVFCRSEQQREELLAAGAHDVRIAPQELDYAAVTPLVSGLLATPQRVNA